MKVSIQKLTMQLEAAVIAAKGEHFLAAIYSGAGLTHNSQPMNLETDAHKIALLQFELGRIAGEAAPKPAAIAPVKTMTQKSIATMLQKLGLVGEKKPTTIEGELHAVVAALESEQAAHAATRAARTPSAPASTTAPAASGDALKLAALKAEIAAAKPGKERLALLTRAFDLQGKILREAEDNRRAELFKSECASILNKKN